MPELIELSTPRLLLRRARMSDLVAMHAVLSDPVATRYWSTPPHLTLAQSESWLASMVETAHDDFVVTLEKKVVGKAGFFRDPEVGFILHPDVHGRGYGGEAVRAVIERALGPRGLDLVSADVDPRNQASLRLLAKLGFYETGRASGTWQVGDELCDSVYLAITRETFLKTCSD